MRASLARWRPVRSAGFFHSANLAPLSSAASVVCPPLRAEFQTSRRTSSSASVAHLTTWKGSRHTIACGQRRAATFAIPAGGVRAEMGELPAALGAERVEEALQGGLVAAGRGPDKPAGVVVDHDREVAVALLVGDLVHPDAAQPGEPVHPGGLL